MRKPTLRIDSIGSQGRFSERLMRKCNHTIDGTLHLYHMIEHDANGGEVHYFVMSCTACKRYTDKCLTKDEAIERARKNWWLF